MQPVAASLSGVARHKRASYEEATYDEDDTDSEIELIAPTARVKKAAKPVVKTRSLSPVTKGHLSLMTPVMKRNKRILNLDKAEHTRLVANATKVGAEYYDSDESDVAGPVKDTTKPHLFRNVRWGAHATDYSDDAQFPTEPEFTQFVPGRFELQPDNTVADQKAKLIVKLTDIHGKKRIFANPPPRDWNDQVAITALNKRTVQQIRRNTHVRFRDVVVAYVAEERKWILDNLTNGKPTNGWKRFVDEFNAKFEGKVIEHVGKARPFRTHSSLTKEVERFGAKWYSKGLVPVPFKHSVKRGSKRSEL
ncbi:hypothetical protein P153DRAFT_338431 [Dothidotthia symphoricarpi CBS 119687]|uniref:Uncharacterized protein n=1 Tax=Dothidotthia symphoricarpi CBS 119687 TaxID=1392245 RepID=A0A6A6AHI2_9PLEO|nr:uncharacterized protein P153DRAFT_338431 [Dothidotthia symphoricarpi CBS 119687]KAF2130538.1 hypothetical protein P153DRAFT_338431 [Dothidotthia symphoricarpi CBS 119687]